MALAYQCRNAPRCKTLSPAKGYCDDCQRAQWRIDGVARRAKHDPRDAVYRHSDWGRVRLATLQRYRFNCYYKYPGICLGPGKANQAAHIHPHNGMGDPLAFDEANLVAACAPCNRHEQTIRQRRMVVDL